MPLTDGDRERIIRTAVEKAKSKNIDVSIQTWGITWAPSKQRWIPDKNQKCCALSCVLIEYQDTIPGVVDWRSWRSWAIRTILEVNIEWIESFLRGFDGYSKDKSDNDSFAYDLGFLLKDELTDVQLKMPNL